MATRNQGNNQGGAQGNSQTTVESIKRVTVAGITYESANGPDGMSVSINDQPIGMGEIQQLASFFGSQMRAAGRGNEQKATDGRGQVLHPESDARLKGNEALRQNDPDRAGSNGQRGNRQQGGRGNR